MKKDNKETKNNKKSTAIKTAPKSPVKKKLLETVQSNRQAESKNIQKEIKTNLSEYKDKILGMFKTKGDNEEAKVLFETKYLLIALALVLTFGLILKFKQVFVVATVNGKPVTRLAVVKELEHQYGKNVLEGLVSKELLIQEAKEKGIAVSNEDVQKELDSLKTNLAAQNLTYEDYLSQYGVDESFLIEQIKLSMMYEKLFSNTAEVTDDEINTYIEKNKEYLPAESLEEPSFREEVKTQLQYEKSGTAYQTWLDGKMNGDSVKYFIQY